MAKNAFAVRLPFRPAFAIGTQPRPTRCEYLGWSRSVQADRTPTLRAGSLHVIPKCPLVWLAPAIPEAGVALDLVEGRVEGTELVSDTLDHGPHIRPVALVPASGDEAYIVQPVVDRPVSPVLAHVRNQHMDEVVLAVGDPDIKAVPAG